MHASEIIYSSTTSVACIGNEVPYDHPLVYFEIDPVKAYIDCSYCGKKFVLKSSI